MMVGMLSLSSGAHSRDPLALSTLRFQRYHLPLALPDQHQAQGSERRAISSPLNLPDHEARCRPVDHPRALPDPQKADREREKAYDQEQRAHEFSSLGSLLFCTR
jgi:hypothetical protein